MKGLVAKSVAGLLVSLLVMSAAIFLTAGTLDYWQAWIFLAVFFASSLAVTVYLIRADKALLERRLHGSAGAEKEASQKLIHSLLQVCFIALLILPALDHRFQWSGVPAAAALAGDALVLIGFAIVFLVFRENTWTSGVIEVGKEQKVISTGPYALVRHPMYSGALILLFGIPLALGSLWGLVVFVPALGAIIWRLLDEERFLAASLPGYAEYRRNVRHGLIPFLW